MWCSRYEVSNKKLHYRNDWWSSEILPRVRRSLLGFYTWGYWLLHWIHQANDALQNSWHASILQDTFCVFGHQPESWYCGFIWKTYQVEILTQVNSFLRGQARRSIICDQITLSKIAYRACSKIENPRGRTYRSWR